MFLLYNQGFHTDEGWGSRCCVSEGGAQFRLAV